MMAFRSQYTAVFPNRKQELERTLNFPYTMKGDEPLKQVANTAALASVTQTVSALPGLC